METFTPPILDTNTPTHTHHVWERWVEGEETVSGKVELFTVWVYKTADEGGGLPTKREQAGETADEDRESDWEDREHLRERVCMQDRVIKQQADVGELFFYFHHNCYSGGDACVRRTSDCA